MYALVYRVNDELTRSETFANVIDVTDDFTSAVLIGTGKVANPETMVSDILAGNVVSEEFVLETGDETVSHTVTVSMSRVSADETNDTDIFVPSRGIVVKEIRAEIDTVPMAEIMAQVAAELVNA